MSKVRAPPLNLQGSSHCSDSAADMYAIEQQERTHQDAAETRSWSVCLIIASNSPRSMWPSLHAARSEFFYPAEHQGMGLKARHSACTTGQLLLTAAGR